MGYTSGTAMDDRGLRDIERWRDKIEVRLDNRQVFFLFFGSALVACMLFVLGVVVGKRLESRGRAVSPEIEDPLALLDKVATSPRPAQANVTFPQALFGNGGKASTDKHSNKRSVGEGMDGDGKAMAPVETPAKATPAKVATSAPAGESKPAPTKESAKSESKLESKPQSKSAAKPESKTEPKPTESTAAAKQAEGATGKMKLALVESTPNKAKPEDAKPATIPTVATGGDSKGKSHFTLQLSSFQDKSEAEAFAKKFSDEHPYLIVSDIPGKGIWYRVRIGDFASAKDAMAAKLSFEKKHSVIAYVAQK
jgi:DedD protein